MPAMSNEEKIAIKAACVKAAQRWLLLGRAQDGVEMSRLLGSNLTVLRSNARGLLGYFTRSCPGTTGACRRRHYLPDRFTGKKSILD